MAGFQIIIALLWIGWLIYWLLSARKSKHSKHRYNWMIDIGLRIFILALIILILRVPTLYHFVLSINSKSFYANPYIKSIGLLIAIIGFALTIWARISLGTNWGMPRTVREEPDLVMTGPYAYIRHPIYTGIIVAMIGAVMVTTVFWAVPSIVFTIYFIYSSQREEKDMMREFPKEYETYKKRTKALIPFVY